VTQVHWRLKYDRSVTAKLYELREAGFALHQAIKALKFKAEPWRDALMIKERLGRYEFEFEGYWVGFEQSADPEDTEPTLKILYIKQIIS
jgi:hypothetical protein